VIEIEDIQQQPTHAIWTLSARMSSSLLCAALGGNPTRGIAIKCYFILGIYFGSNLGIKIFEFMISVINLYSTLNFLLDYKQISCSTFSC
jgi:hypothetical protein